MSRRHSSTVATLALAVGLGMAVASAFACDNQSASEGTKAPGPGEGSGRHIREIEAVARATGEPAEVYGVDRPHALTEIEAAIHAAIESGHGASQGRSLTHDPALSAMVRDLARTSPSRFDMPPTLLDALLAWHGVPDPEPAVVVVELQGSDHGCDRAPKPDCAEAIRLAVDEASQDDVVLIAGKGHESYQESAGVRRPFDDLDVARWALEARA